MDDWLDLVLVDTIGDTHLLELKEKAIDLTFQNVSLNGFGTPTL